MHTATSQWSVANFSCNRRSRHSANSAHGLAGDCGSVVPFSGALPGRFPAWCRVTRHARRQLSGAASARPTAALSGFASPLVLLPLLPTHGATGDDPKKQAGAAAAGDAASGAAVPAADAMAAWLEGAGGAVHVAVRQVEGEGRLVLAPRSFKKGGGDRWLQR